MLIALGAEQVVETLQWNHLAAGARESVGEELDDAFFDASEMAITQPCVDRQLLVLESAVLVPGPFRPVPSYSDGQTSFAFRAPSRAWSSNIWQSVSSDGTAAHFDRKTRLGLANVYALVVYSREHDSTAIVAVPPVSTISTDPA